MGTTPANAINEVTTGIVGFTGTSVTGTAATQHAIQVGGATTSTLTSIGVGTTGQVLQANTTADPTFSTATFPSTATGTGKVLIADGTNWVASTPTFPNASATSGKFIRSDGTNWIASTPTLPTSAGTSGKVLQSNGTNYVESTPTYPSASGTSRTMLVSDGTNNVYSTETWATPGTSGNLLKSDGTNWTSVATSSVTGIGISFFLQVTAGNPNDGSTYFFSQGQSFTNITISNVAGRFVVPKTGTINSCYGIVFVGGTLGSTENATFAIRKNNTTDATVTSTLKLNTASNAFSSTSVNLAVTAGDYIEFKFTGPTWATNPTTCTATITCIVE